MSQFVRKLAVFFIVIALPSLALFIQRWKFFLTGALAKSINAASKILHVILLRVVRLCGVWTRSVRFDGT